MPISDQAQQYASFGWPVFPCQPGGKAPLTPCGFHDATTETKVIRTWWRRWPTANVAWPTGLLTADVLDIDVRPTGTGWAALNQIKRAGLLPTPLAAVQTPGGGLHLYFPGTSQNSGSLPSHFLDFKAVGGYVLAPPSTVNGCPYRWLPLTDRPSSVPADWGAIRQFLRPQPSPSPFSRAVVSRGISALARVVAETAEGNRNRILFWAACRAIAEGHGDLTDLLTAAVHAGLPEAEARRTIASARRRVSRARSHITTRTGSRA